jgi:hypothetical protein
LSPIISDNVIGNDKLVHDFFYKLHRLGRCEAAVIEAASFTLIHYVNLSTATKMCVNSPLAFLNGRTKSNPHVEKGEVIGMV